MKTLLNGIYLIIAPRINLYFTETYTTALTFNDSSGHVDQDWLVRPYLTGNIFQNVRTGTFIHCDAQMGAFCQASNSPQVFQPILVSGMTSYAIKTPDNRYLHRTANNQLEVVTQNSLNYTALFTLIRIQAG